MARSGWREESISDFRCACPVFLQIAIAKDMYAHFAIAPKHIHSCQKRAELTFALLQDNWKRMVIVCTVLVLKADAVGGSVRETFHLFGDGGHESGGRGLGNCTARGSGGGRLERCAKGDVHGGNGNECNQNLLCLTRLAISMDDGTGLRSSGMWHAELEQDQAQPSSSAQAGREHGSHCISFTLFHFLSLSSIPLFVSTVMVVVLWPPSGSGSNPTTIGRVEYEQKCFLCSLEKSSCN